MDSNWQVVCEPVDGYDGDNGDNLAGVKIVLVKNVDAVALPEPRPSETAANYKTRAEAAVESWTRSQVTEKEMARVAFDRKVGDLKKQSFDKVLKGEIGKAQKAADAANEFSRSGGPTALR